MQSTVLTATLRQPQARVASVDARAGDLPHAGGGAECVRRSQYHPRFVLLAGDLPATDSRGRLGRSAAVSSEWLNQHGLAGFAATGRITATWRGLSTNGL